MPHAQPQAVVAKIFFHLTEVAQRQDVIHPLSAGHSHPVRHVPSTDQPGKASNPWPTRRSTMPSRHGKTPGAVRI